MKADEKPNLEGILHSAVVQNWADLMHGPEGGLIHVEWDFKGNGFLDHLLVWTCRSRGYWVLACSYWMITSELHACGVHFDNGFQSEGLARSLSLLMQNQTAFVLPRNFGRRGMLEITTPTAEESTAAAAAMTDTFDRLSPVLANNLKGGPIV